MRFQDYAVKITERACDDLMRAVRAVPTDKLEWKPMDEGRSVLDQLQEVSQIPVWLGSVIKAQAVPPSDPRAFQEARQARLQWKTVEECEAQLKQNNEVLFEAIRSFPDEALETTLTLPFGGGMVRSLADIILVHYWNASYHLGQVNYIQTLLGDKDMH